MGSAFFANTILGPPDPTHPLMIFLIPDCVNVPPSYNSMVADFPAEKKFDDAGTDVGAYVTDVPADTVSANLHAWSAAESGANAVPRVPDPIIGILNVMSTYT